MKMNKIRLLEIIATRSGVSVDKCGIVLKTLERVLSEELTRKMYRYGGWILLVIALLVSVAAFGQGSEREGRPVQTIRGIVIDGDSKYPLPYATVRLSAKEGMGTITDSLGRFTIQQVPVGRHTVEAAYLGYDPGIVREILVTSAKEVYLEIPLKESVNELNEVVVRARTNKEEAMNKMATTGAHMLSVEEASRYAGGFDDPARLVSAFAGVAPSVTSNGISIHGNAPQLLQWRLEDVEIPNPNHYADIASLGGGILSSLSSQVLGNSDFFTGAFPAEYGNAVSGVFDMKLRNGNNQKNENTFQVGIMGIDVASEGPLSKKHRASYIFNYRYSTTGLLNLDGGKMNYQDLNFKLNFPTRKAGIFSIWGTSLIDKYASEMERDPAIWEYFIDRNESHDKQYMAAGGITHRYFFSNDASLKTTVAATYSQRDGDTFMFNDALESTPYIKLESKHTNLILTSVYNRKFSNRFTNKTGFTYNAKLYNMNFAIAPLEAHPLETVSLGDGNTSLISAYNSSSIGLSDRLTLNAGIY
ncbi:MAG: carboxypeptidase-like regulatory domain-containing protein [Clostridiales bacterium]|nr:carboxypeptidase-like regulatory domain-containing protein [Clostridiales bacterium]